MSKLFTMKSYRFTFLLALVFAFAQTTLAESLWLLRTSNQQEKEMLAKNPAFRVHFFMEDAIILSSNQQPKGDRYLLDSDAWASGLSYYIVYLTENEVDSYFTQRPAAKKLYQQPNFVVVSLDERQNGQLQPAKTDGMIRIMPTEARLTQKRSFTNTSRRDANPFIEELIAQVSATNITATVQHLQNYGTRDAYHPQSVVAQNWIKSQYEALGMSVEIQDFSMPSGNASDNVIATLPGTKYPNEYVIIGGHYDSYSNSSSAPGADDNASGSAGVLEIARIMSQYSFDRTLIFCAFSGEEYGLYGSNAYASRAAQQGMDIHGYFNLDMIGYLKPGNTTIKSTLIYPPSAQELASFYMDVAATYLPNFVVTPGTLSGGDSDHTSFNNSGFMGIFPFEAAPDYSPYIHTSNDIVGTSYNHEMQAAIFTQASLAAAATMANRLNPPRGLAALSGDQMVELNWSPLPDAASFNIYRNGSLFQNTTDNAYFDLEVENGTPYTYYITAIYADSNLESDPSNSVTVTPMPPLSLPFISTFESGAPYFEFTNGWGISTTQSHSPSHSISESPNGNYTSNTESYAYLRPFSLNNGFSSAELSFWTRYDMETNYDYMYLEVSTNGNTWTQIAQFNGPQTTWQKKTYSLNNYLNESYLQLRFRFVSDQSVNKDGMYIDDFEINTVGGFLTQSTLFVEGWNTLSSQIVPSSNDIAEIFASIESNLIAVQTQDGVYAPQQGLNTLQNWNPTSGYKVKVNNPCGFTISGPTKTANSLNISVGWNLIPVYSDCDVAIVNLFAGNESNIDLAKEIGSDKVFWPYMNINTLENLSPSKAYLVKANTAFTLSFPNCNSWTGNKANTTANTEITPTANTHIVGLVPAALAIGVAGDQILAFTAEGLLAGSLTLTSSEQNKVIALFGNDSLSLPKDGFDAQETIIWKLLQAGSSYYFDLTPTYSATMPNQGSYAHEGLSVIETFTADATGLEELQQLHPPFPNPATDYISLQLYPGQMFEIEIVSQDGKVVARSQQQDTAKINIAALAAGVYIVRVHNEYFTIHQRFIKQ